MPSTVRSPIACWLAALALLIAGVLTVAPAASAPADRAVGTNGPIAFVLKKDIWTRSAGGSFRRVTHGRLDPSWDLEVSPDGRRIAFSIEGRAGVWVVNLNGTGLRNVVKGKRDVAGQSGQEPSWDPAGERLVFSAPSAETGNPELFTVEVDGAGTLRRLTDTGVGAGPTPVWSPVPGSEEIAYVPCCEGRIRIIDAQTLEERWVTAAEDPFARNLDWSPDGERFVVESGLDARLRTVARDGTDWVDLDPDASRSLYAPSWSPDGTTIVVEGLDVTEKIAVLTVDAELGVPGGVTALTQGWGANEFAPDWGPACTRQCVGTELTAKKKVRRNKLEVSGVLLPGVKGKKVEVTLQRRHDGDWRDVATRRVRTRAEGRWVATFTRPKKGRCAVVAEFGGTRRHMPSSASIGRFRC